MGTRVVAIVAVALVTGCGGYGAEEFHCSQTAAATQCGPGGMCELDGFCSIGESSCPSGRKYTDHSGSLSGTCVGGGTPSEAGMDMMTPTTDARLCFGNAPFAICLAAAPAAPLVLSTTTPFNTDGSMCAATTSGATGYCVLAGSTISFTGSGSWRATGSKPLVLIASDSITVSATVDVSSHRIVAPATGPETGAGADFATCPAPATAPATGGGGGGGSFAGMGGAGAAAARANSVGGSAGVATSGVTTLRGGCVGRDGEGGADRGIGGHGGGAVLLIAVNSINITATGGINAAGQGGRAGLQGSTGGGGGGSGGMIVLNAPSVTSAGLLLANGGGGGEGSGENGAGQNGFDATSIAAAAGGNALSNGGDGGNGSAVDTAGGGVNGSSGTITNNLRGGGGGGGGGAGIIVAPASATLGSQISPAPVSQLP